MKFLIPVQVERIEIGDVLVGVEADTQEDAEDQALKAVRAMSMTEMTELTDAIEDFEVSEFHAMGIGEGDYVPSDFDADIDLTEAKP